MSKEKPEKRPVGRPTDYKSEYCQMLIDHMREGFSFESFAAILGTYRERLWVWRQKHEEFETAFKIGKDLSLLWWEKLGKAGVSGGVPGFQGPTWMYNMKVRFGWLEVQKIDQRTHIISTQVNGQIEEFKNLIEVAKRERTVKLIKADSGILKDSSQND